MMMVYGGWCRRGMFGMKFWLLVYLTLISDMKTKICV